MNCLGDVLWFLLGVFLRDYCGGNGENSFCTAASVPAKVSDVTQARFHSQM